MSSENSLLDDENVVASPDSLGINTIAHYGKLAYWLKFFSVIGFVLLGLMVLALLSLIININVIDNETNSNFGQYLIGIVLAAVVFLGIGAWINNLLWGYGKTLKKFVDNRDDSSLLAAMQKRRIFFITSIVWTGLSILFSIVLAILAKM